MTYLQKLVEYFNDRDHFSTNSYAEFELKLLIDPRNKTPSFIKFSDQETAILKCKDLFTHFKTTMPCVNKQTINFINSETDVSRIKELHFNNGIQDKTLKKFYTKQKKHAPVYICSDKEHSFKLSISAETSAPETSDYNLIRFKQRFTFVMENWNIDFTFVKTSTSKLVTDIKVIKERLFTGTTDQTIFTENNWIWQYADGIEIEFEYNNTTLKLEYINDIISILDTPDNVETNFIQRLYTLVNPNKLGSQNANTLKKILPNAIEINKKQYVESIFPIITTFYITDKADGVRVLLIINKNIATYESKYTILQENTIFHISETIIECEMINGKFYAFDILKYDGVDCVDKTFDNRLKLMYMLSDIWENLLIKNFVKLTDDYATEIKTCNITSSAYNIDGIIFTSCNDTYKHTKYYKWKNMDNMTIDFVAKKCPSKLLGVYPYVVKEGRELYLLFSGIKQNEYNKFNMKKIQYYNTLFSSHDGSYFPVQFSPSDCPNAYLFWHDKTGEDLDNKIVELLFQNEWKLIKVRRDRVAEFQTKNYFGNNFKVAELIWRNYSNPLTMELLCAKLETFSEDFYFKVHNSEKHMAVRKFNNMVKSELLERLAVNFTPNAWVVDLGCGKGQDIHKYIRMPMVKNVLFIDNNENNLCSIIERKYGYGYDKKLDKSTLGIYMQNLDLNNDSEINYNKILKTNINLQKKETKLVVCNFAIHYFTKSNQLDNFIDLVDKLMPSGSRFLFTCLNGEAIYKLLETNKEMVFHQWGDGEKYLIKPQFANKRFIGGEEIDILLPFSDKKLYRESLVNLSLVEKKFKKKKIMLESQANFADIYLEKFKQTDILFEKLDKIDMEYLKLVWFSIYYKK
jgi:hypothetical protein